VHDDGSLQQEDSKTLNRVFPGSRLVARSEADSLVTERLQNGEFVRCSRLRRSYVHALKLFDPFFFASKPRFIVLDSDVLFVGYPEDLVSSVQDRRQRLVYSVDVGDRYPLSMDEIASLLDQDGLARVNPGILSASGDMLDLSRVEGWLSNPKFWTHAGASYYAELTLWAMLLTLAGARPLPASYDMCNAEPQNAMSIARHYCGGRYWGSKFYTQGLPYLRHLNLLKERL
jgi:hypothetical protein